MEYYCPMQHVLGTVEGIHISFDGLLGPVTESVSSSTSIIANSVTKPENKRETLRSPTYNAQHDELLTTEIPKVIYQTYKHKERIPQKVTDNLAKYASDYQRFVFDDSECLEFLSNYYHPDVVKTFHLLGGAHKADLFRYTILYLKGRVYMDNTPAYS